MPVYLIIKRRKDNTEGMIYYHIFLNGMFWVTTVSRGNSGLPFQNSRQLSSSFILSVFQNVSAAGVSLQFYLNCYSDTLFLT